MSEQPTISRQGVLIPIFLEDHSELYWYDEVGLQKVEVLIPIFLEDHSEFWVRKSAFRLLEVLIPIFLEDHSEVMVMSGEDGITMS